MVTVEFRWLAKELASAETNSRSNRTQNAMALQGLRDWPAGPGVLRRY